MYNNNHSNTKPSLSQNKVLSKLSRFVDVSKKGIHFPFNLEISSNREAIVSGCHGILEYSDSLIRISGGSLTIKLTGDNLEISSLSSHTIIVCGSISSIEFI